LKRATEGIHKGLYYIPKKRCEKVDLMPVVLKLEGLEFQIPKKFYTMDGSVAQNYQKDCILLFKSNSFANKVGYILGAPFV